MDAEEVFSVQFSLLNGSFIVLDPPVRDDDKVIAIKRRLAAVRGLHHKQIQLLHNSDELTDDLTMLGAGLSPSGLSCVSVIQLPCQVRPSDYESYIDRSATGFLPVSNICYPFGFPAERSEVSMDPDRLAIFHENDGNRVNKASMVEFPPPGDININMMPFVMGKKESLPDIYHHYWPLIEQCSVPRKELGKVGYLTIHESLVRRGESQRRPGLHIESPGNFMVEGGVFLEKRYYWGCGGGIVHIDESQVHGGIYMASNVPRSCKVWDMQIKDPGAVVGKLGCVEHLREVLGEGSYMEPEKLYWITDVTPHESVPLQEDTYRQYFRLVTSSLTAWYPENASENELGIRPDEGTTKIVVGNKFV